MKKKNLKKILIIGGDGYIGSRLVTFFKKCGEKVYYSFLTDNYLNETNAYKLNITDRDKVFALIKKIKPDVIIHVAGISSLNKCESDKELAYKVNVLGTKNVIEAITLFVPNSKFVFISSDYVFDGEKGNYKEKSDRKPKTYYGENKLISENDIMKKLENYIICRSANVFGDNGGNFFNFLMENLSKGNSVDLFSDTFYTPTYIDFFRKSLYELIKKDFIGVVHIAGKEKVSRHAFGLKLANILGVDTNLIKNSVSPTGNLLSKDSSLNTDYMKTLLDIDTPSIDNSLFLDLKYLQKPYFIFKDSRGDLIGITQNKNWKEINYLTSKKGVTRGGHYHKSTVECFFIIKGKIRVTLSDLSQSSSETFIINSGDILEISPNILHTFEILENSSWINMLSKPMKGSKKDIHKL